jgi:hypothetical protein
VQGCGREPPDSECYTQSWAVGKSNFAYVGTQFDYCSATQYDETGDVNDDWNTNA